eukprot:TRINITY_DN3203_c0_g5_i1.p1 TRINITY_DN3203_c0_g5~~TRINITY_DN3203_c0_g5_i1.p1  ORF type:complete len:599 (+),score=185.91 TRINITY_DN3203_c0_g5_i1:74-1870(+)
MCDHKDGADAFEALINSIGCDSPAWSPESMASDGTTTPAYSPWMESEAVPQKLCSSEVRPTFLLNVPVSKPGYNESPETCDSQSPNAASPKPKPIAPQPPPMPKTESCMGMRNFGKLPMSQPTQHVSNPSHPGSGKGLKMSHAEAEQSLEEVKRIAQRAKRSAIARRRPRDERGHFLSTGVALKIGTLESELNDSRSECSALREQVKQLQTELWRLQQTQRLSPHPHHPHEAQFMAPPVARSFIPLEYSQSIQHKYTPGSYRSGPDEPFREKIDFSKVNLRKTNSGFMTPQEREFYLNQQLQWEIGQGVNDMRRKADEYMRVSRDLPQSPSSAYFQFVGPVHPGEYNAPPSSVFSQPNKSGNVLLPAFREKVDLAQQANQLRKIDDYEHAHAQLQRQQAQIQQQQQQLEQQRSAMLRQLRQHAHMQQRGERSVGPAPHEHQERSEVEHGGHSPAQMRGSGSYAPMSPDFSASPHSHSHSWPHEAFSPAMSVEGGMSADGSMSPHLDAPDDHMEMQLGGEHHHHHHQHQHQHHDAHPYRFGGPPSDIYTPPEKIGNRQVPAFKEKVNFAEVRLNKTEGRFSSPETPRANFPGSAPSSLH